MFRNEYWQMKPSIVFLLCISMLFGSQELFSMTDARNRVVLNKDKSFSSQVIQSNTTYVIRHDFDLSEETNVNGHLQGLVAIPEGSTLIFAGGSLRNGVVNGSNTRIVIKSKKVFSDIDITGTWIKLNEGSIDWFDEEDTYNRILSNLDKICYSLNLNDFKISVEKAGLYLSFNRIYSPKNATITFLNTSESDVNGVNLMAKNVVIENITIREDFDTELFPQNNVTAGVAIGVYDPTKKGAKNTYSIVLKNCSFTGGFSSSCFASSYVSDLQMINCSFSDIKVADHLVYCSTNISDFKLDNVQVSNCQTRTSMFKIRHATNCNVTINGVEANNYKGSFLEYDEAFGHQKVLLDNLSLECGSLSGGNLLYYGSGDARCSFDVTVNNLVWRQNENAKYRLAKATTEAYHTIDSFFIRTSRLWNTNLTVEGKVMTLEYDDCAINGMPACDITASILNIKNCYIDAEIKSGGLFRSGTVKKVCVDNVKTNSQHLIPGFFTFKGAEPVNVDIRNTTFNKIGVNVFMATDTPVKLKMKKTKVPDAKYDINYRGNILYVRD